MLTISTSIVFHNAQKELMPNPQLNNPSPEASTS